MSGKVKNEDFINTYTSDSHMEYMFILGRNPELSMLELVSFLKNKKEKFSLKVFDEDIAIIELEKFDPKKMITMLGGTVKIAQPRDPASIISTLTKNKILYAVSYFKADRQRYNALFKKIFSENEIKALQKYKDSRNIPPAKSKNLDLEFVVYRDKIGVVIATSAPKDYKKRDEKRPIFDPLKVTSIRLAKILINLAQPHQEIFDPFCGTGTILQEALLMGYRAIGLDRSTSDAGKNLEWLKQNFKVPQYKLIKGNAAKLSYNINSVSAVATEPYMGPYLKEYPKEVHAIKIVSELTEIYSKFFSEISKVLEKNGKIAIILPEFRTSNRRTLSLNINALIKGTNLKIFNPAHPEVNIKVPIIYKEKKGFITRYIYILEKI